MSVFIDDSRFKKMRFSPFSLSLKQFVGTSSIHKKINCSLSDILYCHQTYKESDYLTNAIHYKGAPLVYTCNNNISGLLGKKARLTYVPSSPMLRLLTGTGVAFGALSAVSSMVQSMVKHNAKNRSKHIAKQNTTQKRSSSSVRDSNQVKPTKQAPSKTVKSKSFSMLSSLVKMGVFTSLLMYPFETYVSKYKDYVPFSNYPEVSSNHGKWMIFQHYDSLTQKISMVIVVPLPRSPLPTASTTTKTTTKTNTDFCAIRLSSSPLTLSQRVQMSTFQPNQVESCVVQGTLTDVQHQCNQWVRLSDQWKGMWENPSLTYMTITKYNETHVQDRFASALAHYIQPMCLTMHELLPDEKKELNTGQLSLCRVYPVATHLPKVFLENVVYYETPLHKLCESSYVHKAQLSPHSVHHLFAVPLQLSKIEHFQKEEKVFIEQSKEYLNTKHKRILDQLEIRKGFTKYILIYVSSNRINNHIDQYVELFQPYACEVYTCVVPSSVRLTDIEQELSQTTLGGERFALRSRSAFVQLHGLKLYSSLHTNAILANIYKKVKKKTDKELSKHNSTQDYANALGVVVDQQYENKTKQVRKELKEGQWNPKKRFRTKKELRQIMLYYIKKQKQNKTRKPSVKELERQMAKLSLKERKSSKPRRRHRRATTARRQQIVIM